MPFLTALAPTVPPREQQPHPPAQSPVAHRGPGALHLENPSGAGRRACRVAVGSTHGRLSTRVRTRCVLVSSGDGEPSGQREGHRPGLGQSSDSTCLFVQHPTLSGLFSRPRPLCQAHCPPLLPSPSGLLGRGSSDLLPHPLSHLQLATCIRFPKLRLTTPPPRSLP